MIKGEAFLKHCVNKNLTVSLKKWITLPEERRNEFDSDLQIANVEGEVAADVFGDELKQGSPVYKFKFKGVTAYCLVGNFAKLNVDQKQQFEQVLIPFKPA